MLDKFGELQTSKEKKNLLLTYSQQEILKDYIRKKNYVTKGKSGIKIKNKYVMKLRNV